MLLAGGSDTSLRLMSFLLEFSRYKNIKVVVTSCASYPVSLQLLCVYEIRTMPVLLLEWYCMCLCRSR